MTVKLLAAWGKYPVGTAYSADAATEAALVAQKVATTDLTGAVALPEQAQQTSAQRAADLALLQLQLAVGQRSDELPPQIKALSATGQVVAGPCRVLSIRCTTGSAVTLTLRDGLTQNQADADTTSPTLYSSVFSAGDPVVRLHVCAVFGLHATLSGAATFELEF